MAIRPSNFEPQTFAAGDTISFQKALADYPAPDWSLEYDFDADNHYEIASVADGQGHVLIVAAAVTTDWIPGEYSLTGFAINAGTAERVQIYQGRCVITPNLPEAAVVEKTHAQKMIALIEAVQLGKASHDILESDVENTRIRRLSPKELREEYAFWKNVRGGEIDGERAAAGLPNRNKIKPRFQITGFGIPIGVTPTVFPR